MLTVIYAITPIAYATTPLPLVAEQTNSEIPNVDSTDNATIPIGRNIGSKSWLPLNTTVGDLVQYSDSYIGKIVSVSGIIYELDIGGPKYQLIDKSYSIDLSSNSLLPLDRYVGSRGMLTGILTSANGKNEFEVHQFSYKDGYAARMGAPSAYASTGTQALLMIPVKFNDKSNTVSTSSLQTLGSQMGSYYLENSFGQLSFNIDTLSSWQTMPNNYSFYTSSFWQYLYDGVSLVHPSINLNNYQFVIVVHAGADQAISDCTCDIWSAAYRGGIEFNINGDIITVAAAGLSESDPMGVFAHETGHMLGLPDLYDISNTQTFVGKWDLMDEGGYNGFPVGSSPAHFTSYGKIQLGWMSASNTFTISGGQDATITLAPLETPSLSYQAMKISLTDSTYYLVEVRQQLGYDSALPGHGVLILYVDETLQTGHGIVRVRNPSLLAYGIGGTYQDVTRNLEIDVTSSSGSSYSVHFIRSVVSLSDAYFTSILVTNGNTYLQMIGGGTAKVYSGQAPVWFNLTYYNNNVGTLGATLYTQFVYTTKSGYSSSTNSQSQYVLLYTSYGTNWYTSSGLTGPDTYYVTVKLFWDNSGVSVLEDQKEIVTSVVKLAIGNWSATTPNLQRGSSAPAKMNILFANAGNDVMYNVRLQVIDTQGLAVGQSSISVGDLAPSVLYGSSIDVTAPSSVQVGTHQVAFKISYQDFRGVSHDEYWNAQVVVKNIMSLTLSYSILGGGSGYSSPTLTYVLDGVQLTEAIGTSPTTFTLDTGSSWSITKNLPGSSGSERWETNQVTSGIALSSQIIDLKYYHQYLVATLYSLAGGGAPGAPSLQYSSFGQQNSLTLSLATNDVWADSGSTYSFGSTLGGSSQTERWLTNSATTGVVSAPIVINPVFYHQYLITISYSVIGGGTPQSPSFSYSSLGETKSSILSLVPEGLWIDAGTYSVSNPLPGSSSNERWYSANMDGTIISPTSIVIAYVHQFLLTIHGAPISSQWYDSGSTATVPVPGIHGRDSGAGLRTVSYNFDNGPATDVAPTTNSIVISILMDSSHVLTVGTVSQYQVILDSSALEAINQITAPTIIGDNYWYDSGSSVSVVLNGVWDRNSGVGSRLVSFELNGAGNISVSTTEPVSVLTIDSLTSPQAITTGVSTEYQLNTPSGSLVSITPPSILGDGLWYDSGTEVKATYNHVWNESTSQSRSNALGFSLDGLRENALPRTGAGTFSVIVRMDGPHTVEIISVIQYHLTISGGPNVTASPDSPTKDGFYDSSSTVTVSTEYIWNLAEGKNRQILTSHTLDGKTTGITRSESGIFTTPTITFDRAHSLIFNSATQYFVTFTFTDNSGSKKILPTDFSISVEGKEVEILDSEIWIDGQTKFSITNLVWQNTNVSPLNATFTVSSPQNLVIHSRVYDAELRATDLLGIPISGANAQIVLANGTTLTKTTSSDGTISLSMVPLGKFDATISNLGSSTRIVGDASQQTVTEAKVSLSYPTILTIAGVGGVAVVLLVLKFLRKKLP